MTSSVYLDTNVLIRLVESEDVELRDGLERVVAGGGLLITSELTLAEVLVRPLRLGAEDIAGLYEDLLTSGTPIRTVAIDRRVLRKSAELRSAFGGKLPDTIHLATASLHGCQVVLSSDKRLRVPPELELISADNIQALRDFL